jgi:hypothetical protein
MPLVPLDQKSPPVETELWSRATVLKFFGGDRPLHPATLYRGIGRIYPRPINVSDNVCRWIADECRVALQKIIAKRDEPKPPSRRGRPPKARSVQVSESK